MKDNTKPEKKLPEVIKIGDQEIPTSHPEIQKLLGIISSMEKDKLYDTLESYKKDITLLRQDLEKVTKAQQPTTPKPQTQPVQQSNFDNPNKHTITSEDYRNDQPLTSAQVVQHKEALENPKVMNMTPEQIQEALGNVFKHNLPLVLNEALKPINERLQRFEQESLNQYRERKLQELGDQVIPDLVKGSTIEEIDQSIELSRQLRNRYAPISQNPQPAQPTINPPVQAQPPQPYFNGNAHSQNPYQQPANPGVPVGQNPIAPIALREAPVPPLQTPRYPMPTERKTDIKSLSDKDFAAQREQIQRELQADYSSN
jgi:hypothetical protein